ncbi:polyphosphate polymerase domain-containing protein [Brevibacterium renqingii]|uniref:polyphosphate polymerase domain-containing protein n=1 Tax=Brevibacterium renqingii TaxID=2776916 RepID=UPI001AE04FE2|nr:polyphosphate polymerase domain-containing protein [Brevibacterium renqingii]
MMRDATIAEAVPDEGMNPALAGGPASADSAEAATASGLALETQLQRLAPISLDEINAQARLMTRVDRKYFLPRGLFIDLLAATRDDFRVLEIGGKHRFEYRTTYFDTPDFRFYRDHVQERRHRFKVRTRTYVDTGTCHLEVKSKGYRGQTVKERIAHPLESPLTLTPGDREFIDSVLDGAPAQAGRSSADRIGSAGRSASTGHSASARARLRAADLEPVVETVYDRITLCHADQRLTCDLDIRAVHGDEQHVGPSDVLVETKSPGGGGIWDGLLKQVGVRPHKVSKYCVSAALLYPQLPSNPWERTIRRYFR